MKRSILALFVVALLNLGGTSAFADGPSIAAQPTLQPDPQGPTAGGSATAAGGDAGPAAITMSEPITASSSTSPAPGGPSNSSTNTSAPGARASAPLSVLTVQPQATTPDGSVPQATTTGPSASADASRTTYSASTSRVQAHSQSRGTAGVGVAAGGIGSAEDPTYASTCTNADVSPGVPTDASLGTMCGGQPTTASEQFGAGDAGGNRASGDPSARSCLVAGASAGASPSGQLGSACTSGAATSSTTPNSSGSAVAGGSSAPTATGSTGSGEGAAGAGPLTGALAAARVLGLAILPSTTTAPASLGLLGTALIATGVLLLRRRRSQTATAEAASRE